MSLEFKKIEVNSIREMLPCRELRESSLKIIKQNHGIFKLN